MNRTCKLLLGPVVLLLLCFFLFVARHRFIDADEGDYLLASRLVLEHKVVYLDFLYTQAPLLPYVYGLWMKLFGISWLSARVLSAVLTTTLGLLIYQQVCHQTRRSTAGLAAVVLYVSSTYIFAWLPIVKTYSLAALFLFGGYVIVSRLRPESRGWLVAVAGALFGLSVDTRSYVAGLAPIFLWWIYRDSEARTGIVRMLWFVGGVTVGLTPSLYLFAVSPDMFLFDNLGFHAIQTGAGLIGAWRWKLKIARIVLFGAENGIQFSVLAAISLAAILVMQMRRGAALLAFLIAVVLGFLSILPTPPFVQYFCLCMPFLIVAAVCATSSYVTSLGTTWPKRVAVLAGGALLAAFVASAVPSFRRYLVTGDRIGPYTRQEAPNWTLDKASAVSEAIDEVAAPKEEVAAFWPGYIFPSKAEPYPGFETDFSRNYSRALTASQRSKYHILTGSDVEADFAAHTPRIVVLGNLILGNRDVCGDPSKVSICASELRSDGYTVVRTIGDTSIFAYGSASR